MTYDVVIAGAGPVGLFLACELRLAGLSVLVLEQAEDPGSPLKRLPFGMRGLSVPTIEAFYRRGLLSDIAVPQRAKNDSGNSGAVTTEQGAQQPRRQAGSMGWRSSASAHHRAGTAATLWLHDRDGRYCNSIDHASG